MEECPEDLVKVTDWTNHPVTESDCKYSSLTTDLHYLQFGKIAVANPYTGIALDLPPTLTAMPQDWSFSIWVQKRAAWDTAYQTLLWVGNNFEIRRENLSNTFSYIMYTAGGTTVLQDPTADGNGALA